MFILSYQAMGTLVGSLTHRKAIIFMHTCSNLPVQGHVLVSDTWDCMQSYAESLLDVLDPQRRYISRRVCTRTSAFAHPAGSLMILHATMCLNAALYAELC